MAHSLPPLTLGTVDEPIIIQPRFSRRTKRLAIRIGLKGVELIIPHRLSLKRATAFLHSKEEWIRDHLRHSPKRQNTPFAPGSTIPVLGIEHTIVLSGKLRGITTQDNGLLLIHGYEEHAPRKIQTFLKDLAKSTITTRAQYHASQLGVKFSRISVKDTTTRWGSCSSRGTLSFSWRLVMAPPEVLDYVVAHEIAHLQELNHSKAFWRIVQNLCPHQARARHWLKVHGRKLHGFGG